MALIDSRSMRGCLLITIFLLTYGHISQRSIVVFFKSNQVIQEMHLQITEMSERCSELVSKEKVEACYCQYCGLTHSLPTKFGRLSVLKTLFGFYEANKSRKKNRKKVL